MADKVFPSFSIRREYVSQLVQSVTIHQRVAFINDTLKGSVKSQSCIQARLLMAMPELAALDKPSAMYNNNHVDMFEMDCRVAILEKKVICPLETWTPGQCYRYFKSLCSLVNEPSNAIIRVRRSLMHTPTF